MVVWLVVAFFETSGVNGSTVWFTQWHKPLVSGLHQDPSDPGIRHHWLAMLHLSDRDLPPRAGVCHFSPECFSNLKEVNMGSNEVLMLKSKAVNRFHPGADSRTDISCGCCQQLSNIGKYKKESIKYFWNSHHIACDLPKLRSRNWEVKIHLFSRSIRLFTTVAGLDWAVTYIQWTWPSHF